MLAFFHEYWMPLWLFTGFVYLVTLGHFQEFICKDIERMPDLFCKDLAEGPNFYATVKEQIAWKKHYIEHKFLASLSVVFSILSVFGMICFLSKV
jgi:hypothetical protein